MDGQLTGFFGLIFGLRPVWREQQYNKTRRADVETGMENETSVESDAVRKFPADHDAIMGMLCLCAHVIILSLQ
jgi:hypothetical protein